MVGCRPRNTSSKTCTTSSPSTSRLSMRHPRLRHRLLASLCAVFGKVEGTGTNWHGHVTAVTVAPAYRRLRLAEKLMGLLEDVTHAMHDAYFVDLFVRVSNAVAIGMYTKVSERACEGTTQGKHGWMASARPGGQPPAPCPAFKLQPPCKCCLPTVWIHGLSTSAGLL